MALIERGQEVIMPIARQSVPVRQSTARVPLRRFTKTTLLYVGAILILLLMALPYFYLLLQSLAPWTQVDKTFIPSSLTLRSYVWIWTGGSFEPQPWLQGLFNSLLVSTADTVSAVVVGAIVGYALSMLPFRGRRTINNFILFQMFYPGIILLVPTFLIIRTAGLYNTYWAMIIPRLVDLWGIFMYTSFFRTVPFEYIEAARIEGASELRIIFRLMMPLARSITTVIFLLTFMGRWTDLMWDLIVVKDPARQTLNVLLTTLFGPYGAYPGPLYAAGVLLTLPIVVLFLIFSRNLVKGVQMVLR